MRRPLVAASLLYGHIVIPAKVGTQDPSAPFSSKLAVEERGDLAMGSRLRGNDEFSCQPFSELPEPRRNLMVGIRPLVRVFTGGVFAENGYVVSCPATRQGILVDPGAVVDDMLTHVKQER